MKRLGIVAVLLAFAGVAQAQTPQKSAEECGADQLGKFMNLSPSEFDQTLDEGWRKVGNMKGCELAAADLIAMYRDEKLAQDIAGLDWHEAQLRAAAGETARAIELFRRTLPHRREVGEATGDMSDVLYAEATIAFLEHDRPTLEAKRTVMSALRKPEWFDALAADHAKRQPGAAPMTWPMNLDVVDGFLSCFDKPYAEAYSSACRPKRVQ